MPYALCTSSQDATKKRLATTAPLLAELRSQRLKVHRSTAKEFMEEEDKKLESMANAVEAALTVLKCVITPTTEDATLQAIASLVQKGGTLSVTFARLYVKVAIHTACTFGRYDDACSVATTTSSEVLATM